MGQEKLQPEVFAQDCRGPPGPPGLLECIRGSQAQAMGQAKHPPQTLTKEPCKGHFNGHRVRASLSLKKASHGPALVTTF